MTDAATRALVLFTVLWLVTGWWSAPVDLAVAVLGAVHGALPASGPVAVVAAYLLVLGAVRLLMLPLWVVAVPVDRTGVPVDDPVPRVPLHVLLLFRRSRFLAAFLLEGFVLLVALRALPVVVEPSTAPRPVWLAGEVWNDTFLGSGLLHALVLALGWGGVLVAERVWPRGERRRYGFLGYHRENRPLARLFARLVVFVHLPLAVYTSGALEHPYHLLVVGVSLLTMLMGLVPAYGATAAIEQRRDARLGELGEGDGLRSLILRELYPGRAYFPEPAAGGPEGAPAQERPELVAPDATAPKPDAAVPESSPVGAQPAAAPAPVADGWEPREQRPEPVTDRDVAHGGATGIDTAPPSRGWRWLARAGMGLGLVGLSLLAFVGAQWASLPSAAETRQLARSAHVHVAKRTVDDEPVVSLLGTRFDYSLNTSLANVSPHFVHAVIASEDHRYFEHGALYKLAKFAQAGGLCVVRRLGLLGGGRSCAGNSTIPQQLARNLFLSEERSIVRKLRELLWALKIERAFDKDEVLEMYLNRLYLGRGNFGVEMATRSYFGKPASELDLHESAFLAAAIKRPGWNWHENREGAHERARLILALMRRHGYADADERFPEHFRPRQGERAPHKPYLGHLWQWIRPGVAQVLGSYPDGTYKVLTTLDAEVQIYAERHLEEQVGRLRRGGTPASQGAVVVMRPDGEVLAMVGGVGDTVQARGLNRAKRTRGLHARPPASAFKPVVYLAALETGLTPRSRIDAGPVDIAVPGVAGHYRPENHDGRVYGQVTLREGLVRSINTAAVHLLRDRVGFARLFDAARRLGIDLDDFREQWGVALGAAGVPPVEMVSAYGVFANGGHGVAPYGFVAVTTEGGRTVWRRPEPAPERVFDRADIAALNEMLAGVLVDGTGRRARHRLPEWGEVAGKTGTGDGFVDAWFIGYTGDIVIGVWVGNDRPMAMPGVYGGTAPAVVFNRILRDLVSYTSVASVSGPLP